MRYLEKVPMHIKVDADQFQFLSRLVDEQRSNYSQVIRELLAKIMEGENERDSKVSHKKSDVKQ